MTTNTHSNLLNSQVNYESCSIISQPPVAHPLSPKSVITKIDSGASRHYFTEKDKHILYNRHCIKNGPKIHLADGSQITSTEAGHLPHMLTLQPPLQKSLVN